MQMMEVAESVEPHLCGRIQCPVYLFESFAVHISDENRRQPPDCPPNLLKYIKNNPLFVTISAVNSNHAAIDKRIVDAETESINYDFVKITQTILCIVRFVEYNF